MAKNARGVGPGIVAKIAVWVRACFLGAGLAEAVVGEVVHPPPSILSNEAAPSLLPWSFISFATKAAAGIVRWP